MHVNHELNWIKMNVSSLSFFMLVTIVMMLTKCTAKSKLSLWIDEAQVKTISGNIVLFFFSGFLTKCTQHIAISRGMLVVVAYQMISEYPERVLTVQLYSFISRHLDVITLLLEETFCTVV